MTVKDLAPANSIYADAYQTQIQLARKAAKILEKFNIAYINSQERTGKTIPTLIVADELPVHNVLIIVKAANFDVWEGVLRKYTKDLDPWFTLTTFGKAKHYVDRDFDMVIIDEAHNVISAFPTPGINYKFIRKITLKVPYLLLLSASPHGNSYAQLFHQFWLSKHTPWPTKKTYKGTGFYEWFNKYGIPDLQWAHGGRRIIKYNKIKHSKIKDVLEKYFVGYTRQELGFEYEPQDVVHKVELSSDTMKILRKMTKDRYITSKDIKSSYAESWEYEMISHTRMLHGMYQVEGGTLKLGDESSVLLPNTEKIEWILDKFGDTEDLVIFYHYVKEYDKLKEYFKKAKILQGTSYAEGIDLSMHRYMVVYSQDWSTIKYSQRRCRQANVNRKWPIEVHFLLVEGSISDQVYQNVAVKKRDFIDSMFEPML